MQLRRVTWLIMTTLLVAACAASRPALLSAPGPHAVVTAGASVTVMPWRLGVSGLQLGVTHTQYSADDGTRSTSASARAVLEDTASLGAQSIMGWGVGSPEPYPGRFDWSTLDRRVELITATSRRPVITLCCAPDWMKGGRGGSTNWSNLDAAPTAANYQAFAGLAAAVAQRYPQVRDFQVWNELKGFWDPTRNTWNIEAYTALYNAVYRAVKRVRPDARIGGPYLPITSFSNPATASDPSPIRGPWGVLDQRALTSLDYFLRYAEGCDFIVLDGSSAARDGTLWTDPFSANQKFTAATAWIRTRTSLPVWWAEYYPQPPGQRWSGQLQAAVHADALMRLTTSGAAAAFLWQPNQDAGSSALRAALWTDVRIAGGGQATPTARAYEALRHVAPPGTLLYQVRTLGPVSALASSKGVLVVNRTPRPLSVVWSGRLVDLAPYAVEVLAGS